MGSNPDRAGKANSPQAGLREKQRLYVALLLWAAAFGVAAYLLDHSWHWFDNSPELPPERLRVDGNNGHAQIDFGGQWVMGRMLVQGHGRKLYHRQRQWEVVRSGYPVVNESPATQAEAILPPHLRVARRVDEEMRHDADWLMYWFMGTDSPQWRTVGGAAVAPIAVPVGGNPFLMLAQLHASAQAIDQLVVEEVNRPAIGGPLYPPIHAFLYAPLALDDHPQRSYSRFQFLALAMVVVAGLGVRVLTQGRIWWSVATLGILLYPGTRGGLDLGQNPTITLTIVIWGWALASRGYNTAGGMVWGLLAFKPVWGLAFFLVPLLMRRWRFCMAMVFTGCGLAAATLPVVGLQTWFDWLAVGKEASGLYNVNQNWINLSRDLQGIPRRILHDFNLPEAVRDTQLAKTLAWSLWGTVLAATVAIYSWQGDHRRPTGVGAAFLFFAAYLTCYRFMYYDALLSVVGFVVLLAEPMRLLRTQAFGVTMLSQVPLPDGARSLDIPKSHPPPFAPRLLGYMNSFPLTILVLLYLVENAFSGMHLQGTLGFGYYARTVTGADGLTSRVTPMVQADTGMGYPWETFLVLAIWAWCGWRLLCGAERRSIRDRSAN